MHKIESIKKELLKDPSVKLKYSLSLTVSCIAIFLQIYTQRFIGTNHFHVLYPAVFFIAWYLGFGPSLVAILSITLGCIYVLEPLGEWNVYGRDGWISLASFLFFSLFFSWLVRSRKKAARNLVIRTAELEALTNNLPQLVWMTDKYGNLRWLNKRWNDYTGMSIDEVRGNDRSQLHHPEHMDRVLKSFYRHILTGQNWEDTFPLKSKSGEFRWHLARAVPVRDENGQILSWFGTHTDIHEKRQIEAELRIAKEKAETANQAKSYFLANMSHEIRTPLGVIMGYLDLIKNGDVSKKEALDYMHIIDLNSQQLMKLIDDILDVSRIEAGKMVIEPKEFSIRDLLASLSSSLAIMAHEKGIQYEILFNSMLPDKIKSDAFRIRQILINLIGNSMKFTAKGSVKLSVHIEEGNKLIFEVSDTGFGIAPESVPKLFQPFCQGDDSSTRKFGGTGLGLALSKKFAQALGGDLFLHSSKVNEGSVFKAIIPFETPEGSSAATSQLSNVTPESSSIAKSSLEGINILLVEDSLDNQLIVSTFLKRTGATVDKANDGLEGMTKALNQRQKYDVVLMDIQMPHMDGYQATQKLREAGFNRPIIALTAHAMTEERDKSLAAGFSEHLTKPFNKFDLIDTITKYVH